MGEPRPRLPHAKAHEGGGRQIRRRRRQSDRQTPSRRRGRSRPPASSPMARPPSTKTQYADAISFPSSQLHAERTLDVSFGSPVPAAAGRSRHELRSHPCVIAVVLRVTRSESAYKTNLYYKCPLLPTGSRVDKGRGHGSVEMSHGDGCARWPIGEVSPSFAMRAARRRCLASAGIPRRRSLLPGYPSPGR
jgi:hypothetical protein